MLGVIAWFGPITVAAVYGGAGQHLYDITDAEFNIYLLVLYHPCPEQSQGEGVEG